MNTSTTKFSTANITRGVCILQHVTAGDPYAISCGQPATFIAFHQSWGRGMECCEHVARDLMDKTNRGVADYQVAVWQHIENWQLQGDRPGWYFTKWEWLANYIAEGGQA
jgi:hypothetical protein